MEQPSPPIILAAQRSMTEVVLKMCTDPQVDIFVRDRDMNTVVHEVVATRNYLLLKFLPLVCHSCPKRFLTMRNGKGLTPLHLALELHRDLTLLKLLLLFDDDCDAEHGDSRSAHPWLTEGEVEMLLSGFRFDHQLCIPDPKSDLCSKQEIISQEDHKSETDSHRKTQKMTVVRTLFNTKKGQLIDGGKEQQQITRAKVSESNCSQLVKSNSNESCVQQTRANSVDVATRQCGCLADRVNSVDVATRQCGCLADRVNSVDVATWQCGCLADRVNSVDVADRCMLIETTLMELRCPAAVEGSLLQTLFDSVKERKVKNAQGVESRTQIFNTQQQLNECEENKKLLTAEDKAKCPSENLCNVTGALDDEAVGNKYFWPGIRPELIRQRVMGSKETLLHFAARGCHRRLIEFLIACGAEVNARDMFNNTPLHSLVMACPDVSSRCLKATELLLMAGADPNLQGTYNHNSVDRPAPIKPEHRQMTVTAMATVRDHVALLPLLSDYNAHFEDTNALGWTPLVLALKNDSWQCAEYLTTEKKEQSGRYSWSDNAGNSTLHFVSSLRSGVAGRVTRWLLAQGYRYDTQLSAMAVSLNQTFSPVTLAICKERMDLVQEFLAHDPTSLLAACRQRHRDLNPLLVAIRTLNGDCPELPTWPGARSSRTSKRAVSILRLLLAHGVEFDVVLKYFYPEEAGQWLPLLREGGMTISAAGRELMTCLGSGYLYGADPAVAMVWSLRQIALRQVRRLVRGRSESFQSAITSLPLPACLKEELLCQTGHWAVRETRQFEERYRCRFVHC